MEFDSHHKVKIETLTLEEAKEFDGWLSDEYWRHERCVMEACDQKLVRPIIIPILESAVIRHTEDLFQIYKLRIKLREVFEL